MAYDLLYYICPPNGKAFLLSSSENCQSIQMSDGWIEFHKNRNMEEFYVTSTVIGRGADTSDLSRDGVHADGTFYVQYTATRAHYGCAWAARFMEIGDQFQRQTHIAQYNHDMSTPMREYDESSTLKLTQHFDALPLPNGQVVRDVLEFEWIDSGGTGQELYYYANGYGLVGFKKLGAGAYQTFFAAPIAAAMIPFPHHGVNRPAVALPPIVPAPVPPMPAISVPAPVPTPAPAPVPSTYPDGTNPAAMQINLPAGLWLHAIPNVGSDSRISLLAAGTLVTVYALPVVVADNYRWQRVTTQEGVQGWCAASVGDAPSFVPPS